MGKRKSQRCGRIQNKKAKQDSSLIAMPTEILLMIFGMVEVKQLRPLTMVCKRFNAIIGNELLPLTLKSNLILLDGCDNPVILRNYKRIQIDYNFLDKMDPAFLDILLFSQSSALKLQPDRFLLAHHHVIGVVIRKGKST